MQDEVRQLRRRHLLNYPEIVDDTTGEVVGRVVDVTTRGLRVVGDRPLQTEGARPLSMVCPEDPKGRDHVRFEAEPVWSAPDVNSVLTDTGLRITSIDSRNENRLAWLIRRSSFRD